MKRILLKKQKKCYALKKLTTENSSFKLFIFTCIKSAIFYKQKNKQKLLMQIYCEQL